MAAATEKLEDDLQALRRDVAELAASVKTMLAEAANAKTTAEDGFKEGLNGAARAGQEFMSDTMRLKSDAVHAAGDLAGEATSFVASEIRRNPLTSVIAALCLGFVAGLAQRR